MVTTIYAQSEDVPRYEVGAQFSSVTIKEPDSVPVGFPNGVNQDLIRSFRTEPGLGGRFTVNLSPNIAFEAETNFFPNDNGTRTYYSGGRTLQVVAGAKLGKRIEQFGFFGKVRPGFVRFNKVLGNTRVVNSSQSPFPIITTDINKTSEFAVDLGGVLEFYPSRRVVTRFDIGDTIIRYQERTLDGLTFGVSPSGIPPPPTTIPITFSGETKHNFQFNAGIGFRF